MPIRRELMFQIRKRNLMEIQGWEGAVAASVTFVATVSHR